MRTYQPNSFSHQVSGAVTSPACDEKHIQALNRWLSQPNGDTEYGASLYTRLAASAETQGATKLAEDHLIEAYKLCRNGDLISRAADVAERLYILLFNKGTANPMNERKAMAWKHLAESLRNDSFRYL